MTVKEKNTIDVTLIEPRQKHPTIFRRFDELGPGEELVILNDHDPKPLYYQLLGERGEVFEWKYLQDGPERWIVSITRLGEGGGKTIGEIVAADWRKAEVFRKYGIDFCCGGKKPLGLVCSEKGLNVGEVEAELRKVATTTGAKPLPFHEWKADFLADYIVNTHHAYVRKSIPEIRAYAHKVAMVHGEFHPELHQIRDLSNQLADEMTSHMMKEEQILFPYIKQLATSVSYSRPHFGSVSNPVAMMEHEHDDAGRLLEEIRELSDNYTLPAEACASYSLLYRMLEEFEQDLHAHVHLENNILFPTAVKLEESKRNKRSKTGTRPHKF